MECIFKPIRGQLPEAYSGDCHFCTKKANKFFGIIKDKKVDGNLIVYFGICDEHLEKLNCLLTGDFDIDELLQDKYRLKSSKKFKMREL